MGKADLEFLSAVLIVSDDAERLARFYRDQLGVPLRPEQHGETLQHWGCELGDVHFAIHPRENCQRDHNVGVGAVKLAFMVFDLDAYLQTLTQRGVEPLYEPEQAGALRMTAVRDPDGNFIELTELGRNWFERLRQRREQGFDVVTRWQQRQSALGT
jgi:catechol 2,3-dioxygenase-like lactoylglutathione lyase family enzyme